MGTIERLPPEAGTGAAILEALDALHDAGELHMRALIAINTAKDRLEAALMRQPIQQEAPVQRAGQP